MKLWSCPACGREFGRTGQSHFCIPATTVDEYYAHRPAFEREVYEAVAEVLLACGPVHVEAVGVGILFKKRRTFVELRPMRGRLRLSFIVARRPEDARIVRRIEMSGGRTVCYVDLRDALDVDDEVRGWLVESYADSPE
jgi:hypothetical protein